MDDEVAEAQRAQARLRVRLAVDKYVFGRTGRGGPVDDEVAEAQRAQARLRVRLAVDKYGLIVICLACGAGLKGELRHRPERDGRLRRRSCPRCGVRGLRLRAWILKHPERARKLRREYQHLESVFR